MQSCLHGKTSRSAASTQATVLLMLVWNRSNTCRTNSNEEIFNDGACRTLVWCSSCTCNFRLDQNKVPLYNTPRWQLPRIRVQCWQMDDTESALASLREVRRLPCLWILEFLSCFENNRRVEHAPSSGTSSSSTSCGAVEVSLLV